MKAARQSGFTLVELLISILIGLFLVGGLLTLTSAMKRTYSIQGGLTQLADNERVAYSLMTDVIQQAGYFTNPTVTTAITALPAISPNWLAGQGIYGYGDSNTTPSETLSVRYMTTGPPPNGDGVLNCLGAGSASATPAAPVTWINTFGLDVNGNLYCTLTTIPYGGGAGTTAQPVTLMSNVTQLMFFYGVQTNTASGTNSVDLIMQATSMTAANWLNTMSVQIVLAFKNPLYAAAGSAATAGQTSMASQPPTRALSRVVVLMSMVGVTS